MTYGYIPSEHVHYRTLKVCQLVLSVRCVRTAVQRQYCHTHDTPLGLDGHDTPLGLDGMTLHSGDELP